MVRASSTLTRMPSGVSCTCALAPKLMHRSNRWSCFAEFETALKTGMARKRNVNEICRMQDVLVELQIENKGVPSADPGPCLQARIDLNVNADGTNHVNRTESAHDTISDRTK